MQVEQSNFWEVLPVILEHIASSRFVSIDCEMTGISAESSQSQTAPKTLQEAYLSAKKAAETYQIVEIGLTFSRYHEPSSTYQTASYNIPVSPLVMKTSISRLIQSQLGRNVTISANSYAFLQQNGFNLSKTLDTGTPYLSRSEEDHMRQYLVLSRGFNDAQLGPLEIDKHALAFRDMCRYKISTLIEPNSKLHTVVLQNPYGGRINNFQARLVMDLVQKEFTGCVAERAGAGSGMIVRREGPYEARTEQQKVALRISDLNRSVCLRYVFEALAGGSLAEYCPRLGPVKKAIPYVRDLREYEKQLKQKRPILVGHNLFYDMVFIYHTFFGSLPGQLDDFLSAINSLFPRIIDTKHLDRTGKNSMMEDLPLEQLHNHYQKQQFPMIVAPQPNFSYAKPQPHQAGYDSYVTMVLFLKQSHDMLGKKRHLQDVEEECYQRTKTNDGYPSHRLSLKDSPQRQEELKALRHYPALVPISMAPGAPQAPPVAPQPSTAGASSHQARVEEAFSVKETYIIPSWDSGFWKAFGNKTRLGGKAVAFD
ncbi:ribonuclease H-like domain-containing protein [Xylariomycetidae sp. FL0641]|nr:ribonuclease H-like domain-containing protein [Xylariomycetidae sp. FL0641]